MTEKKNRLMKSWWWKGASQEIKKDIKIEIK
jgi:hypothetical protein